ncbi:MULTISPECIES: helix-turn-helix transcriptional regulator [unclassified Actinomyces]|uniref:helix-turn-helix domain-containing protein n=1 Tax=unclassified Actinomyces TaxID=2609248 RepID=UPI0013739B02|nr:MULTISPECIES: helix-turn-helix transcriptional regulator [unclassified Actinomyces]MBW3070329.1 helix-turn-helix transcriptional regulator [Actinomyces sp. 594]NDR53430.1 helix-turn-helix transcriptional regulator [Actinomyces sp. 565]QHO90213.1 hypothetical protein CWT12_01115 [Actinomyces sp. 432]
MRRFDTNAAPELIRAARRDVGLTQTQLAERAGLRQPSLAQMESGRRPVSDEMLERTWFPAPRETRSMAARTPMTSHQW